MMHFAIGGMFIILVHERQKILMFVVVFVGEYGVVARRIEWGWHDSLYGAKHRELAHKDIFSMYMSAMSTPNANADTSSVSKKDIVMFSFMLVASSISLVCVLFIMLTAVSNHEMKNVVLSCVVIFLLLFVSVLLGVKIGNSVESKF